jgi:integrase
MGKHIKRHRIKSTFVEGIAIRQVKPNHYVVDFMVDYKRTRKGFDNLEDATVYARTKKLEIRNKGTAALTIGDKLRVEVTELLKKLGGRATLTETVDFWLFKHPATSTQLWDETARLYLQAMRDNGRREISVDEKQYKFDILSEALGNPPTMTVDKGDIEAAVERVAGERGWNSETAEKYVGAGLTLLRFFRGESKKMRTPNEKPPVTWTATEVEQLMHAAERVAPGCAAVLAVQIFAGVRPNEAMKLGWDAIDLGRKTISISADTAKTWQSRHIDIAPNLFAWLTRYQAEGPLVRSPVFYRACLDKVKAECGLSKWPHDVLRHTAATEMYARTSDVEYTCAQLGHMDGSRMFLKHYKGIAPEPEAVKKFWAIAPVCTNK